MSAILTTARLRLRELVPGDAGALARVFADPYAQRFYPWMAEPGAVAAWIERNREGYARHGFGLWALVLAETGELVGDCGLALQEVEAREELEVGWHVRADWRGRGLATEAGRACRDWALHHVEAPRVVSLVHLENAASRVVAARVHSRLDPEPFERRGGLHVVYYTGREGA